MLVVTIELWPGGASCLSKTLATAKIGNTSDLAEVSNYRVHVNEAANPLAGTDPWAASVMIVGHQRRSSVWSLVAKVANLAALNAPPRNEDA